MLPADTLVTRARTLPEMKSQHAMRTERGQMLLGIRAPAGWGFLVSLINNKHLACTQQFRVSFRDTPWIEKVGTVYGGL